MLPDRHSVDPIGLLYVNGAYLKQASFGRAFGDWVSSARKSMGSTYRTDAELMQTLQTGEGVSSLLAGRNGLEKQYHDILGQKAKGLTAQAETGMHDLHSRLKEHIRLEGWAPKKVDAEGRPTDFRFKHPVLHTAAVAAPVAGLAGGLAGGAGYQWGQGVGTREGMQEGIKYGIGANINRQMNTIMGAASNHVANLPWYQRGMVGLGMATDPSGTFKKLLTEAGKIDPRFQFNDAYYNVGRSGFATENKEGFEDLLRKMTEYQVFTDMRNGNINMPNFVSQLKARGVADDYFDS